MIEALRTWSFTAKLRSMPLVPSFVVGVTVLAVLFTAYAYLNGVVYGPPIRADGYGYYAYLPSLFIDGDLSMRSPQAFQWTVVGNHILPYIWDGISKYPETGRNLDKYTLGTALLQSPFFITAHLLSRPFGFPANGYSLPYQIANVLSGITYLILGVWLLLRYLLSIFSSKQSLLVISSIIFATNVLHYATYAAAYSHVYSFFLCSLLLFVAEKYRQSTLQTRLQRLQYGAAFGVVLGLITLTRVPNLIEGCVPLFLMIGRWRKDDDSRAFLYEIAAGFLALVVTFSPQMLYWHATTGHFLLNSYQNERFYWTQPHILEFLISLRRGLFVWTPILLLAVPGLPLLIRKDKWLGLGIALVITLEIYICSSWWSWWFGDGFGARTIVDIMPLLAIPLGYGFGWVRIQLGRAFPIALVAIFVLINLFSMLSLWQGYLPWDNTSVTDFRALPEEWGRCETFARWKREFLPAYTPGTPFTADQCPPASMLMFGWEIQPAPAIFTDNKEAKIYLRPRLPERGDLCLRVAFGGPPPAFLAPAHPQQRAIIRVNGRALAFWKFKLGDPSSARAVEIPRDLVGSNRLTEIAFELPDAASPAAVGVGSDPRSLGLFVSKISVDANQDRCAP